MPAVRSAFDVAFWFLDRAFNDNEYLQPQKMQQLLYLAQAYYAVLNKGQKLMPAVFVADEIGPVEPNVYVAFSRGKPAVDVELFLPDDVERFLDGVWRRFGQHTAERLTRMGRETMAYRQARQRGPRSEIPVDAMRLSFTRAQTTPGVDQVVRPKVLRTQSGRPVTVRSWTPAPAGQK